MDIRTYTFADWLGIMLRAVPACLLVVAGVALIGVAGYYVYRYSRWMLKS